MRVTLAVEGKETNDGRIIRPGAITWEKDEPIPVRDGRDDDSSNIIGYVEKIRRENRKITGNLFIFHGNPIPDAIGADMDYVFAEVTPELLRFTGARLRGISVVETPSWPECRIGEPE